ncbi:MAG TPA: hypothetical protein VFV86_06675 [Nitrososphaeraceae archaeon]|nr:hypothetical protein [Nitrososphaeraceae archaeon]
MVNAKEENKNKQSEIIKEETKNVNQQQRQQLENTTNNISESIKKINDNINEYQQETINTIQSVFNNYVELQKNVFDIYRSSYSQFFDNINSYNSYWKNFNIPQRYSEIYNTINKNIYDSTVNASNISNEISVDGIENFNKAIELTQRYYNDIVQNNFTYARRIERSYNRQ